MYRAKKKKKILKIEILYWVLLSSPHRMHNFKILEAFRVLCHTCSYHYPPSHFENCVRLSSTVAKINISHVQFVLFTLGKKFRIKENAFSKFPSIYLSTYTYCPPKNDINRRHNNTIAYISTLYIILRLDAWHNITRLALMMFIISKSYWYVTQCGVLRI